MPDRRTPPSCSIEYGDFECPQCARAHAVLQAVLPELGEDVRFIFRNFPVRDIHPHAQMAAEAAESVAAHGGNEAFWDMHDVLFENQDALEPDDLLGYAAAVGVDRTGSGAGPGDAARWPRASRADVQRRHPQRRERHAAFFVNGRRFDGNWSDETSPWHFASRS